MLFVQFSSDSGAKVRKSRVQRWRFGIAVALTIGSAIATAKEDSQSSTIEDCSASIAIKTRVRKIASDPSKYNGRCVEVHGVMRGLDLFEDVDGVYLEPKHFSNPSSNGAQLGLDNLSKHYSEDYQHVAIVGRIQDCEEARACVQASAGPDEIVMISGYCHTADGAYIWINELRRRPGRRFERQMGNVARPGYGDLTPAPPDWIHRAHVEELASDFLEAVRSEDGERIAALHFRNVGLEWEEEEAELVRFIVNDQTSPFRDLRNDRERPQSAIFVTRELLESSDERDLSNYEATVCFCREANCNGRWPIATFDADNLRTRPYVCTRVGPYIAGRKRIPHFETELGKVGLAEPKRR